MGHFIYEVEQLKGTLPTTFFKNLQHFNVLVYPMKKQLLFEKADGVSDILCFDPICCLGNSISGSSASM